MKTHEDKTKEQKCQQVVIPVSQYKGISLPAVKVLNNKPDIVQGKANNNIQARQTCQLQAVTYNHPAQQATSSSMTQLCKDKHGLVPPTTHGRGVEFEAPVKTKETKGHRHVVPRKKLTRFERMIDRIGRILATNTNVHIAVALDDKALVLSTNKENTEVMYKLDKTADKLKDILKDEDPLTGVGIEELRVSSKRRTTDKRKIKKLLNGEYTHEESGIELNEEVSDQLVRLKTAIEKGVINYARYTNGEAGIYVAPTSSHDSDRTYNMHGELKVSEAIKNRRDAKGFEEKDVYMGGTLADCFACNASHKILNEELATEKKGWKFYSGGTHGGMFVGYRASSSATKHHTRFKEITGEEIVDRKSDIPKVNVDSPQSSTVDDSDSDTEDYPAIQTLATLNRKLQSIGRNIRKKESEITKISKIIEEAKVDIIKLTQEQQKLQTDAPKIEEQLKEDVEAFETHNKKTLELKRILSEVKKGLEVATFLVEETKVQIRNTKGIKLEYKKEKLKGGMEVEFNSSGGANKKGWTGKERIIEEAIKTTKYKERFDEMRKLKQENTDLSAQIEELERQGLELQKKVDSTKGLLERLKALPDLIRKQEETIAELGLSKGSKTEEKATSETERTGVEQALLLEKAKETVTSVKPKFDWMNSSLM